MCQVHDHYKGFASHPLWERPRDLDHKENDSGSTKAATLRIFYSLSSMINIRFVIICAMNSGRNGRHIIPLIIL